MTQEEGYSWHLVPIVVNKHYSGRLSKMEDVTQKEIIVNRLRTIAEYIDGLDLSDVSFITISIQAPLVAGGIFQKIELVRDR